MRNEDIYTDSVNIATLKGEINVVTIKIYTNWSDGVHTLKFSLSHIGNEPCIKRIEHKVPYGGSMNHATRNYMDDINTVREHGEKELERLNLDIVEAWHSTR